RRSAASTCSRRRTSTSRSSCSPRSPRTCWRSGPPPRSRRAERRVTDASDAVEKAWRSDWGRLLGLLAGRFRDLDLAEDALADAFEAAARTWPTDGVPANPPAWLLTAARRRALDRLRGAETARRKLP